MIYVKTLMNFFPKCCKKCDYCCESLQPPFLYICDVGFVKEIAVDVEREKPEWCPLVEVAE